MKFGCICNITHWNPKPYTQIIDEVRDVPGESSIPNLRKTSSVGIDYDCFSSVAPGAYRLI